MRQWPRNKQRLARVRCIALRIHAPYGVKDSSSSSLRNFSMKSLALTALLAAMAVILPVLPGAANDKGEPDPVRIGMVQTLFADVPTPLVNLVTPTFKSLMKDFTGLNGDPNAGGDAFEIGKKLMDDKLHIGVLHGVEFAWVAQKYPEIKPLMIAVSKYHSLKAHVIVKGDCPCVEFAELKGKDFAVPFRAREHLRLYVEKNCN